MGHRSWVLLPLLYLAPGLCNNHIHFTEEDDFSLPHSPDSGSERRLQFFTTTTDMTGAWFNEIQRGTVGHEFFEVIVGTDLAEDFENEQLHLGVSTRSPYFYWRVGLEDADHVTTLANGAKVLSFSLDAIGFTDLDNYPFAGSLPEVVAFFVRHGNVDGVRGEVYDCLHYGVVQAGAPSIVSRCPRIHDESASIDDSSGRSVQRRDFGGSWPGTTAGDWSAPEPNTRGNINTAQIPALNMIYDSLGITVTSTQASTLAGSVTTPAVPVASLCSPGSRAKCLARGADVGPLRTVVGSRADVHSDAGCEEWSCCCYELKPGSSLKFARAECFCLDLADA
mmetsp:Transcript_76418/g.181771  ORF Transcript_76418/g.181771 Transcript_76418/m.181771 type:complete len:337 (-) Transcript_76418:29-1039(-)